MTKFISFDIEIATPIPDGEQDWKKLRPLGISCAAAAFREERSGKILTRIWTSSIGAVKMAPRAVFEILTDLEIMRDIDFTLVTWNGAHFDFDIMAEEIALNAGVDFSDEIKQLCLDHVDLMAHVVAERGHYLGLSKACKGMGIEDKLHDVTLRDGSAASISGADAPRLWQEGEREAVLAYLRQDVISTLLLAEAIHKKMALTWTSKSGRGQWLDLPRLMPVKELLQRPPAKDTGWMTDPKTVADLVSWMGDKAQ